MIIKDKREDLTSYLEDTSNIAGQATVLYIPEKREEVSSIVRKCIDGNTPFTVLGGHTGTTGAAVAQSGAVISLEKLNRVIGLNPQQKTIHIEAGATLEELEEEAKQFNLTLRASPTESLAFVGGALATSASGVRGFGYGSIRKYVREIEVVLPTSEVIVVQRDRIKAHGRKFDFKLQGKHFEFELPSYKMPKVKSQAGYFIKDDMDLIDLFIGSEGTLGVITSCILELQDIACDIFDGLVFFKEKEKAYQFIVHIKELKDKDLLQPASLEFFDNNSLEMLKNEYSFIPEAEAAVYFEQESDSEQNYEKLIDKWAQIIEEAGASLDESIIADTPAEREKVFSFRHSLPQMINEFLRQNKQVKVATDIAVPWENFRQMYDFYYQKAKEIDIDYVNFGHVGQAHLHFNFLPKTDKENIQAKKYLEIFCKKAVSLGGTVSAEHGIGKIKKEYLKLMYSNKDIKEMARLKRYFDPYCLMGLDNIFDKELLCKI